LTIHRIARNQGIYADIQPLAASATFQPMKSYTDKLAAVTSACVVANPDIARRTSLPGGQPRIRLTDAKWMLMEVSLDKNLERDLVALSYWWNLDHDALDFQSNECVGFLYDRMTQSRLFRG
jgi:hypothetical protein